MPLNRGYIGVSKETTPGTGVAPTLFFTPQEFAEVRANVQFQDIPGFDSFGPLSRVPAARYGEAGTVVVVTPKAIGAALHALLGNPTTTGTAPNYQHTFTPKTAFPSYTLEAQDGVAIHRLTGAQVNSIEFSHEASGYLTASIDWIGLDRTTTATAASPTLELAPFATGQASVSVGGTAVGARVESIRVTISLPKSPFNSVANYAASEIQPEGTAEVTAQLSLLFDATADANRLGDYLAGTSRAVLISWQRDANTSLQIAFEGVLTEDPFVLANRDSGMARIQLSMQAVRSGSDLVTVTLKNQQASY